MYDIPTVSHCWQVETPSLYVFFIYHPQNPDVIDNLEICEERLRR